MIIYKTVILSLLENKFSWQCSLYYLLLLNWFDILLTKVVDFYLEKNMTYLQISVIAKIKTIATTNYTF